MMHSELVELRQQDMLSIPGSTADYAYFPIDSFISVVLESDGAGGMEVAMVGNEGMFNTATVLGATLSTFSARVQGAGQAIKIHRKAFYMRRTEDARLRNLLLRYIYVVTSHLAQRVVCINYHNVEQRLARSLLMSRDRSNTHELFLTHENLAFMAGARRESISHAAGALQERGVISYARGYVILLDEPALELISCPCYELERNFYERILNAHNTT